MLRALSGPVYLDFDALNTLILLFMTAAIHSIVDRFSRSNEVWFRQDSLQGPAPFSDLRLLDIRHMSCDGPGEAPRFRYKPQLP